MLVVFRACDATDLTSGDTKCGLKNRDRTSVPHSGYSGKTMIFFNIFQFVSTATATVGKDRRFEYSHSFKAPFYLGEIVRSVDDVVRCQPVRFSARHRFAVLGLWWQHCYFTGYDAVNASGS
jgi:hypothetical protein